MGCGRAVSFSLFVILLSMPLSFASQSKFTDCFPNEPLPKFWQDEFYLQSNPKILKLPFTYAYSFDFENTTGSLGLENLTLMSGESLLFRIPPQKKSQFSQVSSLVSQAEKEIALGRKEHLAAASYLLSAKKTFIDLFNTSNILLLLGFMPFPPDISIKAFRVFEFLAYYHYHYSAALHRAAQAHDLLQSAALSAASLAQEEYEFLSKAGAGSPSYFGYASEPYYRAQSLLASDKSFCAQEIGAYRKIYSYFGSKPILPDFSKAGFPERISSLGGVGENSSIMRMVSLYLSLSEAKEKMLSEYSSELLKAESSSQRLSNEISLLGSEKLELIGEGGMGFEEGGTLLLVGSEYGGIYSGYIQAKKDLQKAEGLIGEAKSSFSSKNAQNWLSSAMDSLAQARKIADSALSSTARVKADAKAVLARQKDLARAKISEAKEACGSTASDTLSANAVSSCRKSLAKAEEAFESADFLPSLGEKYRAYSKSIAFAESAVLELKSQQASENLMHAKRALLLYSSLVSKAKADGMDLSYESELIDLYRSLLSSSQSSDVYAAVLSSLEDNYAELIARIKAENSHIEEKHQKASEIIRQLGGHSQELQQRLGKLDPYFSESELLAERAAGNMKKINSELDAILSAAEQSVPKFLSAAISNSAYVSEIKQTPVLGAPTDYFASIYLENPSTLSFPGESPVYLKTTAPIYSSELKSGEGLVDAYPERGKSVLVLAKVLPRQKFAFSFAKKEQPVQIISSEDLCAHASNSEAAVRTKISFIASRDAPELSIRHAVDGQAQSAYAIYLGKKARLFSSYHEGGWHLEGKISDVMQGKGEVWLEYSLPSPFIISVENREYEAAGFGAKKASVELSVRPAFRLDCPSAAITFIEPYVGIKDISASSLTGEKVIKAISSPDGSQTSISLQFSPLAPNRKATFLITYTIQNSTSALSEAMANAELLVLTYNRSKDASVLAEAKKLASLGNENAALALLSNLLYSAKEMETQSAEYFDYNEERSASESYLAYVLESINSSSLANSTIQPQLASIAFKYQSSLASASKEADLGNYKKALAEVKKANSELRSSLASLSLSALKKASEEYASARKSGLGGNLTEFGVQESLSKAQAAYTEGDFLKSIISSAEALSKINELYGLSESEDSQAASKAALLQSECDRLKSNVEETLSSYSQQYAILSSYLKKQMGISPSSASSKIAEASKLLSASRKAADPKEALRLADSAHKLLSSLNATLSSALSSLSSSAKSSLEVAKAALSEVKARADPGDASQISAEVEKAEDLLSNSMYAESISASERAIRAANAALSKANQKDPAQALALGLISLAFFAAAVYYFFFRKKEPKGDSKKGIPKGSE